MSDGDGRANAPEPRDPPWFRIGRLLPTVLRLRVFEPAYLDLAAERNRSDLRSKRFGFRVLTLALDTYRVGAPRLLIQLLRGSAAARMVVVIALAAIAIVLLLMDATVISDVPYVPGPRP